MTKDYMLIIKNAQTVCAARVVLVRTLILFKIIFLPDLLLTLLGIVISSATLPAQGSSSRRTSGRWF